MTRLIENTPTIETDGDNISRQGAVNEIHKYFVEEIDKTPTEIDEDGYELYADMPTVNSLLACNKELSRRIKSLPSASEPIRQRGKWIKATGMMPPEFHGHHCCSVCGGFAGMEVPYGNREDFSNFCPSCGAVMEDYDITYMNEYERAVDQMEHDIAYEPTYDPEDGSM